MNIHTQEIERKKIKMETKKIGFKCCLCGKHTIGWDEEGIYGNNPAPLKQKGQCCDDCNNIKVIPARLSSLKY